MEQKRALTADEISEILSFVSLRKGIPEEVAKFQQENVQNILKEQLEKVTIYPSKIPEFKKIIEMKYITTQIPAGTMVGALAATSIGEPMTQLVLNSFHSSGIAKSNVTTGIPRMEELINVTSNNKMCGMRIYLKDNDHTDIVGLRSICKENLEYYSFEDIVINKHITSVDKIKELDFLSSVDSKDFEDWHDYHSLMVSDNYKTCKWAIVFKIDKSKLYQIKKTLIDIADIIDSCCHDTYTICSDEETGVLLCYVDITDLSSIESVEKKRNKQDNEELSSFSYINEENKHFYYLRDIVLPELFGRTISGIDGVSECIYDQPLGTGQVNGKKIWVINTRGSNFRETLNHPLVDHTRTTTSRIKEIESVLGIEAARIFLLNEFANIISSSKRHIEQLVNCMTFSGKVRAANRHGIDKSVGILAQMSFEQPIKNAIDASLTNQVDNLKGVSSQLMLGKYARIGSGFVDVYLDTKKVMKHFQENNTTEVQNNAKNSLTFEHKKDVKPLKKVVTNEKSKHTEVGEIVSRKTFTKSQLKVPKEHIFKSSEVVEKPKHEIFASRDVSTKKYVKKKVDSNISKEELIEKDIETKYKRSKVGFQNSELRNALEF